MLFSDDIERSGTPPAGPGGQWIVDWLEKIQNRIWTSSVEIEDTWVRNSNTLGFVVHNKGGLGSDFTHRIRRGWVKMR